MSSCHNNWTIDEQHDGLCSSDFSDNLILAFVQLRRTTEEFHAEVIAQRATITALSAEGDALRMQLLEQPHVQKIAADALSV